jgi:hypothetical protein
MSRPNILPGNIYPYDEQRRVYEEYERRQMRMMEEMQQRQSEQQLNKIREMQQMAMGGLTAGGIGQTEGYQVEISLANTEYLVVGFSPVGNPDFIRASDAASMQQAVEKIRQRNDQKQICVFKRMLRMKAKTEWETVDADV